MLILAACPVENRPTGAPRLWGGLYISLVADSLAWRVYHKTEIVEPFTCNYELNPEYCKTLENSGLKVSGVSRDGGARIVELDGRRFFVGTGFVPQLASEESKPHPLIAAFLRAAAEGGR